MGMNEIINFYINFIRRKYYIPTRLRCKTYNKINGRSELTNKKFSLLEWSAQSLHLNLIEMYGLLEKEVQGHQQYDITLD